MCSIAIVQLSASICSQPGDIFSRFVVSQDGPCLPAPLGCQANNGSKSWGSCPAQESHRSNSEPTELPPLPLRNISLLGVPCQAPSDRMPWSKETMAPPV